MATDFFKKEVLKAQERFNQTFGLMTVCDLRQRQGAILAVVFLGMIADKIGKEKNRDHARDKIRNFMKTRDILHRLFDRVENQQTEQNGSTIAYERKVKTL